MSREAAINALSTVLTGAFAWNAAVRRRLVLWGDCPTSQRPCAFIFQGAKENYNNANSVNQRRRIEVKIFIYTDAKPPTTIGSADQDAIMDALDAAFAPPPGSAFQQLAGTAFWGRIDGDVFRDPGDLDGDGLLIIPFQITLP